ncbi:MAG: hypothetical protein EXR94_10410 [Gemmatimonadetes bacterium]|nr:hypothetical protein [Gemmatimonadota bacterium]
MAELVLAHTGSESLPTVTKGVGVAVIVPQEGSSHRQLLAAAEAALVEAKSRGGDCVVLASL